MPCNSNSVNEVKALISGIVPVKLLSFNSNLVRFTRLLIVEGIGQVKLSLWYNHKYVNPVQFQIELFKVPLKAWSEFQRLINVTCHQEASIHDQSLTAVAVIQFAFWVQFAQPRLLHKSTRAWHSATGTPVVASS